MNILILGTTGTLGSELISFLQNKRNINISILNRNTVDFTDYNKLNTYITKLHKLSNIDYIINCSALVNTYGIESSLQIKNLSYKTNALIPKYLAHICKDCNIKLIHYSTDYIFSELSKKTINNEFDEFPINLYGYHKLIGELFIQNIMRYNYTIIRVGWLYGYNTKRSFIHKFISNLKSNDVIDVIDDQISTPTSVFFVSNITYKLIITSKSYGVISACPNGYVSKYDYALKILENIKTILNIDLFNKKTINRSKTDQNIISYPLDSRLQIFNCTNIIHENISWQDDLSSYMKKYKDKFIKYIFSD